MATKIKRAVPADVLATWDMARQRDFSASKKEDRVFKLCFAAAPSNDHPQNANDIADLHPASTQSARQGSQLRFCGQSGREAHYAWYRKSDTRFEA